MSHNPEFEARYTIETKQKLKATLRSMPLRYSIFKCICDKVFALLSMPYLLCIGLMLLALNPFFNPGPLLFRQERMGLNGRSFVLWKFRTMSLAAEQARAHDAPLEVDRITVFARYVRRYRFDELPNFFNVLIGDMSLVGPRPDAWSHSIRYSQHVPYYNDRFKVKPGITGLAQIRSGYADTMRAVERKARFDYFYVQKSSIKLDVLIIWRTVGVFFTGFGAK